MSDCMPYSETTQIFTLYRGAVGTPYRCLQLTIQWIPSPRRDLLIIDKDWRFRLHLKCDGTGCRGVSKVVNDWVYERFACGSSTLRTAAKQREKDRAIPCTVG